VVEALQAGLPVVTTSIGAQGLPALAGVASIRDAPDEFADAVCQLLTDNALWCRRSRAQVEYAGARFSEAAFRDSLNGALAVAASRRAARMASTPPAP
jgi:glycosyltransferase involved in cell wall biosynthesis